MIEIESVVRLLIWCAFSGISIDDGQLVAEQVVRHNGMDLRQNSAHAESLPPLR